MQENQLPYRKTETLSRWHEKKVRYEKLESLDQHSHVQSRRIATHATIAILGRESSLLR